MKDPTPRGNILFSFLKNQQKREIKKIFHESGDRISEFERYKREKEEKMENEIDELLKIMAEQNKQFEKLGKKRNEVEYDEKGHILVDINDERQMKLWSK